MLKNLTIGKKIAFGFAVVLVLTTVLGTVGVLQIRAVDAGLMDLTDVHTPLMGAISEIDAAATGQNLAVCLYSIHKEDLQLEDFAAMDEAVDRSLEKAKEVLSSDEELVELGWVNTIDTIAAEHDVFVKSCRDFIEVIKDTTSDEEKIQSAADAVEDTYGPLMAKIDDFLATNTQEITRVSDGATQAADAGLLWMTITGIAAVVIGTFFAFIIARGIITALKRIIYSLTEGSEQVSSAAGQVSSASQSLAEGATEQAAGLEETSSSLEEMSSMTKQNADNAQQANTLAGEARKAADNGAEAMDRMNTAIQDIQKSSDETAKIIKVIDEIAFQTNLLALNAAVEAARAGEAGKGFAVVAEEVRNLAMRSAEAAKNTSELIEESVKNSKNGVDIATEVGKVLTGIVEGIGKTSDLVGEIDAASQEQAQGIEQVNTAVNQMDKVTQQNAANAEESASASEELSAQAEQMNAIVQELGALVGGTKVASGQGRTGGSQSSTRSQGGHAPRQTLSPTDHTFHQIASNQNTSPARPEKLETKVSPEEAIPLSDGEDFNEFNS